MNEASPTSFLTAGEDTFQILDGFSEDGLNIHPDDVVDDDDLVAPSSSSGLWGKCAETPADRKHVLDVQDVIDALILSCAERSKIQIWHDEVWVNFVPRHVNLAPIDEAVSLLVRQRTQVRTVVDAKQQTPCHRGQDLNRRP